MDIIVLVMEDRMEFQHISNQIPIHMSIPIVYLFTLVVILDAHQLQSLLKSLLTIQLLILLTIQLPMLQLLTMTQLQMEELLTMSLQMLQVLMPQLLMKQVLIQQLQME
ncbi:hypothetical protein Mgra_00008509 [Meloidogyne graminicola]|uniref:Uncharacterized protein n=1 Tax=Meloidogyne graminicola TaxID=189291 RepID=A0A8S9ZFG8_9BILA|nr:hypothetical protein Mgra_00008509 [Meloidogyne graminicola]